MRVRLISYDETMWNKGLDLQHISWNLSNVSYTRLQSFWTVSSPISFSASTGSLASETFDHPLSLTDNSTNTTNHLDSPLSPVETLLPDTNHAITSGKGRPGYPDKGRTIAGHGMCLTTSDHDRLKIFMHEFCVRALLPWTEKQMRLFNDQVSSSNDLCMKSQPWLGVCRLILLWIRW